MTHNQIADGCNDTGDEAKGNLCNGMTEVVTSGSGRGEDGGIGVEAAVASPNARSGNDTNHDDGVSAQRDGNGYDHGKGDDVHAPVDAHDKLGECKYEEDGEGQHLQADVLGG